MLLSTKIIKEVFKDNLDGKVPNLIKTFRMCKHQTSKRRRKGKYLNYASFEKTFYNYF